MAFQFFALRHIGDRAGEPFGVIRADGPTCERYLPGTKEWIESPGDQDYLTGEEPGAVTISEEGANTLIAKGNLADVTADDLKWDPEESDDDTDAPPEGDSAGDNTGDTGDAGDAGSAPAPAAKDAKAN